MIPGKECSAVNDLTGYPIGVVARMLNISQQSIRLYEQRGLIKPKRTPGNTRIYTDEDIEILKTIQRLTQDMCVNLSGVEIIIRLNRLIKQLHQERDQMMKMLYEASELLSAYMDADDKEFKIVKSSLGRLVKFSDLP